MHLLRQNWTHSNSLLSVLRQDHIDKLQLVQNSAARLLTGTRKHEHISPILRSLHLLPIPERIDFKLLLLTCSNSLYGRTLTSL